MTLPVYVISSGRAAQHVFNTLAVGGQHFVMLISMAVILAVAMASVRYHREGNIATVAKWSGPYFLTTIILASPLLSQDLIIIDKADPIQSYNVANVPLGVAIPASLISEVMIGITGGIDTFFTQPNDSKPLNSRMENKA